MLFSFESPNQLLNLSLLYNDYDYILSHLLKKDTYYKDFFIQQKGKRFSILDNSAYEYFILGEEIDFKLFSEQILELQPSVYIIPDKMMNSRESRLMFLRWQNFIKDKPKIQKIPAMAIVQGRSRKDWLDSYMFLLDNQQQFTHVGINFHCDCFKEIGSTIDFNNRGEDYQYASGRFDLVSLLVKTDQIMKDKDYHLLGSHLGGEEFYWYKSNNFNFIKTIDTSLPIKYGIKNLSVLDSQEKPKVILDQYLNSMLTEKQKELCLDNIQIFKQQANFNIKIKFNEESKNNFFRSRSR